MNASAQRVSFVTADGLRLVGLYFDALSDTSIVHVHGKCGDMLENAFVGSLAETYTKAGYNFLTFNNRGAGVVREAYRDGRVVYVGGALERFRDAGYDLGAAVDFARRYSKKVVLQGHSHGCEKVFAYAAQHGEADALVLLSPADSRHLQEAYLAPRKLPEQRARLATTNESALVFLDADEYGIRAERHKYSIPTTGASLIDWLTSEWFTSFSTCTRWRRPKVSAPTFVYLGSRDDLQIGGIPAMKACLSERFEHLQVTELAGGDHQLASVEHAVGDEVVAWLNRVSG